MTGHEPLRTVSEQELHMKVGAYDELRHPHGYIYPKERHHWYWFAGIGASIALTGAIFWGYALYERGATPVCASSLVDRSVSPNGGLVAEIRQVSCLGGAPDLRVVVHEVDDTADIPAISAFEAGTEVRLRWLSDDELAMAKQGGRVWFFKTHWKAVRVHLAG
ncbi:hypothetical protein PQU92_03575 [Asticcacaulis sp. BYS171W]|uniref:Uncharacterized protein n=1 Tax=Asticcacaulis aquaticus TaxID=2984212 RepID=A0ABT5HQJ9_9CAUL|nr:hypothetical protein [Asticcacaulis aquaticus]MDC7682339.1 hypothetical protein [Asticcacaulis aquaticus]